MKAYKQLNHIQQNMRAPKENVNDFGGFNYRTAEDVLAAMKPYMGDFSVGIDYDITTTSERVYVKAQVYLTNGEEATVPIHAFAREALIKKGMDESMITGSAQSYALKYALCALCAVSGEADADESNNWDKEIDIYRELVVKATTGTDEEKADACLNAHIFRADFENEDWLNVFGGYLNEYSQARSKTHGKQAVKAQLKEINNKGLDIARAYAKDINDNPEDYLAVTADLDEAQVEFIKSLAEYLLTLGE